MRPGSGGDRLVLDHGQMSNRPRLASREQANHCRWGRIVGRVVDRSFH
jgi:hypothetical protein